MDECELKPYSDPRSKGEQVATMFNTIAPRYDLLNHILSAGIDRLWRHKAIDCLKRHSRLPLALILDVATGTGDLALCACQRIPAARVLAVDFAEDMMRIAQKKATQAHLNQRIDFRKEDCTHLSLPDDSVDAVTSAFALRNFQPLGQCLSEMQRVLKPQGSLIAIDLCAPRRAPMKQVFYAYQRWLMPLAGRLVAHNPIAYAYLPASMKAVPQGEDMSRLFRQAGFHDVQHRYFPSSMCIMYTARK